MQTQVTFSHVQIYTNRKACTNIYKHMQTQSLLVLAYYVTIKYSSQYLWSVI